MKIYAFDVDHTLDVSGGPVRLQHVLDLKLEGHLAGLCGNWAVVTMLVPQWWMLFSFLNAGGVTKAAFLADLKRYIPAEDFILVGNDPASPPPGFPAGSISNDVGAAQEAGWRFIREWDFVRGAR